MNRRQSAKYPSWAGAILGSAPRRVGAGSVRAAIASTSCRAPVEPAEVLVRAHGPRSLARPPPPFNSGQIYRAMQLGDLAS